MTIVGSHRAFPFRSKAEFVLTLAVFPLLWALYAGLTPWRSLEAAVGVPAAVWALYLAAEVIVVNAHRHTAGRFPLDPIGLRFLLRPCAFGYVISFIGALVWALLRFAAHLVDAV